jgi:hypothetical protein
MLEVRLHGGLPQRLVGGEIAPAAFHRTDEVPYEIGSTRAAVSVRTVEHAALERLAHNRRLSHVPPPSFGSERVAQRGGQFDCDSFHGDDGFTF